MTKKRKGKHTSLGLAGPDDPIWLNLGRLYKQRGMKLRARKNFEQALRLVPNKPEILKEIAKLD